MEPAGGFRGFLQRIFLPDLRGLLLATGQLASRLDQMDRTIGALESSVDQVDKGMVQLDHGMNRLDKGMARLDRGMTHLNKGAEQLQREAEEREQALGARLGALRKKLEEDHARAMGEILALLGSHPLQEPAGEWLGHSSDEAPAAPSTLAPEISQDESWEEFADAPLDNVRAMHQLSALLGLPGRDPVPDAKTQPPQDFASILEHIRTLHTGT